jgi:photosystem II stability/assembly factor-like uncharacterized protein
MKPAEGLPENEGKGRIGLAVSHTNPNKVYALLDHRGKGEKEGAAEVYKSVDGGKNWKKTHPKELRIFSSIGWYFADIYVSPKNDDEIYALGVRLAHSIDGGKTFNYIGGNVHHHFPSPADRLHLDHCELWINPKNSEHLALANDGGLYVSYDKGENWKHFNNIPTGEFYDIALDNSDPYTIYGGVQDDATVYGKADEWNPKYPDGWKYLWIDAWSGGDGTITATDPVDSNTLYFSSQEGGIRRLNEQADTSKYVRPNSRSFDLGNKINYNFVAPYFISPHDHSTLYLGGNYIFKSTNRGDDWTVISRDLSSGGNGNKDSHAAGAIAESELRKGLLYMGTDRGLFWVTQKEDTTWTERSKGLPDAYIRSISPSRFKESRVYIAMSGLNYDDFGTYIYKSENYGKTWESISSNLPGEVAYVVKEDPFFENILYAGLFRGAYISTNRGKSWSLLGKNMPTVAVSDLEIDKDSKDLVVATHGRGLYKMNLSPVYKKYTDGIKSDYLFDLPKAELPQYNDTHGDVNYRTAKKLPISFWVTQPQEVKLRILSKDKVLWETKIQADKGFNEYRWDLITQTVDSTSPYFIHYDKFLKKGKYKVQIVTSSDTLPKDFIAVPYH